MVKEQELQRKEDQLNIREQLLKEKEAVLKKREEKLADEEQDLQLEKLKVRLKLQRHHDRKRRGKVYYYDCISKSDICIRVSALCPTTTSLFK